MKSPGSDLVLFHWQTQAQPGSSPAAQPEAAGGRPATPARRSMDVVISARYLPQASPAAQPQVCNVTPSLLIDVSHPLPTLGSCLVGCEGGADQLST